MRWSVIFEVNQERQPRGRKTCLPSQEIHKEDETAKGHSLKGGNRSLRKSVRGIYVTLMGKGRRGPRMDVGYEK